MADSSQSMTYAKAGVDTAKQQKAIRALADNIRFARRGDGRPLGALTHFAGLVQLGDQALAICTDGVGTKIEVANRMRTWDTIGIDAIAMNVNDCICVGAEPLAFVDYLAIAEPDARITAQIGKGLNTGAKQANVTLAGGETAILPEIVNGLDLAGTCVGVVDRDRIIDGKAIRPGDAIVGLASSGLHSNGYTLARRILSNGRIPMDAPCPGTGGSNWGSVLLEPTRIYVRPVMEALKKLDVGGLANITGGALKNIPRINAKRRYVIDAPMDVPPVFDAIQGLGSVALKEMYQTFNMGLGFCAVVPPEQAEAAVRLFTKHGETAKVIGRVERGHGLLHEPTGFEFESKT